MGRTTVTIIAATAAMVSLKNAEAAIIGNNVVLITAGTMKGPITGTTTPIGEMTALIGGRNDRVDRHDNRHKKNAKIGIDVGNDYNHDLRKIFNRAMPDEAIIETLKNPEGRLIRMMQYRDKSTTKP